MTIEEQIKEVEDEIQRTPYNKKTQHHIGKLKAKLARLKDELEARKGVGVGRKLGIRKSGNATVVIVGPPSVGKSTLLNKITDAESRVGEYDFTTRDIIPGILMYKGAKIQVLDMPGLIKGASDGRGRGREVLGAVRNADLILLLLDVFDTNLESLINELNQAGIRLNQKAPDIMVTKKDRGGITVSATVPLKKMDVPLIEDIMREYGYINADIVLREDVTEERLIDSLSGNRVYVPAVVVINKVDLVNPEYLREIEKRFKQTIIPISAEKGIGLSALKERIFDTLGFIRLYLRPPGKDADYSEPLVMRRGSTVGDVCAHLHRDFQYRFRYATIKGKSVRFEGQRVGLNHPLMDGDVLTIVVRR